MPTPNLIWLSSYPKSGNTWFRAFLSNLMSEKDEPVHINELHSTPIASSRVMFDEYAGTAGSDLTMEEIDNLRPQVYREISGSSDELSFHKVHDAWKMNSRGEPVFPPDVTKAVIYFIRDPRDVAVSFAHHSSATLEKMVKNMADENFAFCDKNVKVYNQLRQDLSSWSGHVKSWVDESGLPVLVLRYEDMKNNTFPSFKRAVEYLGLDYPDSKIKLALKNSDFRQLKEMEEKEGFSEKPIKMRSFFREGRTGTYREELSAELIERIERDHGEVMGRFGYD